MPNLHDNIKTKMAAIVNKAYYYRIIFKLLLELLLFMPSLIILLLKKAAFILQAKQTTKINREITVTRQPLSIWSKLPRW